MINILDIEVWTAPWARVGMGDRLIDYFEGIL